MEEANNIKNAAKCEPFMAFSVTQNTYRHMVWRFTGVLISP